MIKQLRRLRLIIFSITVFIILWNTFIGEDFKKLFFYHSSGELLAAYHANYYLQLCLSIFLIVTYFLCRRSLKRKGEITFIKFYIVLAIWFASGRTVGFDPFWDGGNITSGWFYFRTNRIVFGSDTIMVQSKVERAFYPFIKITTPHSQDYLLINPFLYNKTVNALKEEINPL